MPDLKLHNSWNKIGEQLRDIIFGNNFLNMTPKVQVTKKQIDWTLSILKNVCIKRQYQQGKRQATEWEKLFKNHTDMSLK